MPDEISWYPRKQEKTSPEEAGGKPPQSGLLSKRHVGITAEGEYCAFVHYCDSDAGYLGYADPIENTASLSLTIPAQFTPLEDG
jgi:hypothetical protein